MGVVRSGQQQWIRISICGNFNQNQLDHTLFQPLSYSSLSTSVNSSERETAQNLKETNFICKKQKKKDKTHKN